MKVRKSGLNGHHKLTTFECVNFTPGFCLHTLSVVMIAIVRGLFFSFYSLVLRLDMPLNKCVISKGASININTLDRSEEHFKTNANLFNM